MFVHIKDTIAGFEVEGSVDSAMSQVMTWFPEAPDEVMDALLELHRKLDGGGYTEGLETYLALTVTRI